MQADAVGHSHSASQRNEYTKAQAPENLQLGLHDNKTVIIVHLLYPPIIAEDGHNIMSLTTKLFAQYVRNLYGLARTACFGCAIEPSRSL